MNAPVAAETALENQVTLKGPIKAGAAGSVAMWVTDYTRIDDMGLPVRLRSTTRRGKLIWTDDVATVTLPGETPPPQLSETSGGHHLEPAIGAEAGNAAPPQR